MLAAAAHGVPHQIQVGGPPQAQAGGPAVAPSQQGGDQAFDAALTQLLDDLHAIVGLADDPVDRDVLAKCLQAVNGIQAAAAKEKDAAMGGKLSPKLMRKATGTPA